MLGFGFFLVRCGAFTLLPSIYYLLHFVVYCSISIKLWTSASQMELSAPACLRSSSSLSPLLKSRVRVTQRISTPSNLQLSDFAFNLRKTARMEYRKIIPQASLVDHSGPILTNSTVNSGTINRIPCSSTSLWYWLWITTNLWLCQCSDSDSRIGEIKRVTKETNVWVKMNLDGSGVADSHTSIPFLDHMLDVSNLFHHLIRFDLL